MQHLAKPELGVGCSDRFPRVQIIKEARHKLSFRWGISFLKPRIQPGLLCLEQCCLFNRALVHSGLHGLTLESRSSCNHGPTRQPCSSCSRAPQWPQHWFTKSWNFSSTNRYYPLTQTEALVVVGWNVLQGLEAPNCPRADSIMFLFIYFHSEPSPINLSPLSFIFPLSLMSMGSWKVVITSLNSDLSVKKE